MIWPNCLAKVYHLKVHWMMIGNLIFLCMMPAGWFAPTKRIWPEGCLLVHWLLKASSFTIYCSYFTSKIFKPCSGFWRRSNSHVGLSYRPTNWLGTLSYFVSSTLRLNAPLPYPHLVTLFLQHFNIPLDSEPYVPIKRSFLIGAAVVASFGYRKERDGSWVKKGAQPNDDEGHLSVEGDSSLLQSILDRFDGLQTYVGERFDSLELQVNTRFEEMNSRIAKVEEDVTIIHDCLDLPPSPPSV